MDLAEPAALRRRRRTAAVGAALVCLLAVAGPARVSAAPPAVRSILPAQQTAGPSHFNKYRAECAASLQLGPRSGGGQHVTVSAPERCRCSELELSVLQQDGIPCLPGERRCAWLEAHSAETNTSAAGFLVSVGGQFSPRSRCLPPPPPDQPTQPPSRYPGEPRIPLLFVGQPVTLYGIDLLTWNVSMAAHTSDKGLVVEVLEQFDANGTDAYFPELVVTLYGPLQDEGPGMHRDHVERVPFSPERGAQAVFPSLALGSWFGYWVDVRPAGSWVCQGANDGCQRRPARVAELLEKTELERLKPGVEA